jgi:hypothetical protein
MISDKQSNFIPKELDKEQNETKGNKRKKITKVREVNKIETRKIILKVNKTTSSCFCSKGNSKVY